MKAFNQNGLDTFVIESLMCLFELPAGIMARVLSDFQAERDVILAGIAQFGESGIEILWVNDPSVSPDQRIHFIRGKVSSPLGTQYDTLKVSDVKDVKNAVKEDPIAALLAHLKINEGDDPEFDKLAQGLSGAIKAARAASEERKAAAKKQETEGGDMPASVGEMLKKLFGDNVHVIELEGCGEDDCEGCNPTTH